MFTANQTREVLAVVRSPFTALLLYGSHARGDAEENSDIDILQVTRIHTAPYSVGCVNVTCYTLDQLLRIARSGGLFARHLVQEAQPIDDPLNVLTTLKSAYVESSDYRGLKQEVRGCAPLLDVDESQFIENLKGYSSVVSYLVRTYLYATAFEQGARSFGMAKILDLLGQQRARSILLNLRSQSTFSTFRAGRTLFQELTEAICRREEASLEAFIVNISAHNDLASTLGLRLLARGRTFTYDALQDVEF